MSGMQIANDMIRAGSIRYALVCTGEKLSNLGHSLIHEYRDSNDSANFKTRLGAFSAGDAGGAIILGEKIDNSGFLCFKTLSRGRFAGLCNYKMQKGIVDGRIDMGKITARGIHLHRALYSEFLESLKWTPPDINTVITHQTGERMWTKLADVFSVTQCKMTKTYDILGNIATATFPVNLGMSMNHQDHQKNRKIFIAMAGSGLSVCQSGIVL
jgi:3-oxoacyl-[acyl-carrier-protein] synthase-3